MGLFFGFVGVEWLGRGVGDPLCIATKFYIFYIFLEIMKFLLDIVKCLDDNTIIVVVWVDRAI